MNDADDKMTLTQTKLRETLQTNRNSALASRQSQDVCEEEVFGSRQSSFDELERLKKLDDQIQLVPSANNLMVLKAVSPSRKGPSQIVALDGDFFPQPDPKDSLFSIFDKSLQYNKPSHPLTRPIHFRRQRSMPVTEFEHMNPFAELDILENHTESCSGSEDLLDEIQPLNEMHLGTIFRSRQDPTVNGGSSTSLSPRIQRERPEDQPNIRMSATSLTLPEEDDSKLKMLSDVNQSVSSPQLHRRSGSPVKNTRSSLELQQAPVPSSSLERNLHQYLLYLSVYAIFGSAFRVYVSRLFGQDCEDQEIHDFLTPLSTQICVTAGGRTMQSGGGLFRDLPANIIGSFVMGLITPRDSDSARLPWFSEENPLQHDDVLQAALSVGFCGSLTTFASWNSQMVIMMDGTYAEQGSQVIPALFGYLLGMQCAIASFAFGRQVATWLNSRRIQRNFDSDPDSEEMEEGLPGKLSLPSLSHGRNIRCGNGNCMYQISIFTTKQFIVLVAATLLGLSLVGDLMYGIRFYRKLMFIFILTPPGALLRWNLAKWNSRRHPEGRYAWIPCGTFAANVIGATVSILFAALGDRYFNSTSNTKPWVLAFLSAVPTGFAGSLSTVSSMVKEVFLLAETYPGHAKPHFYVLGTLTVSAVVGLCIYSSIARVTLR